MNKSYSNKELAHDYYLVARQNSKSWDTYRNQRQIIERSPIDIYSFFQENGSLSNLDVSGIGPKTKGILELILEKGFEEARRVKQPSGPESRRIFVRKYLPSDLGYDDNDPA